MVRDVSTLAKPPYGGTRRWRSFDIVIRHLETLEDPYIFEIGSLRSTGNWIGDGYSTALFAWYVAAVAGNLTTVDIDPTVRETIEWAFSHYSIPLDNVDIICEDGVEVLSSQDANSIDVLYLDGLDWNPGEDQTEYKGYIRRVSEIEHLKCAEHACDKVKKGGIVLVDDILDIDTLKGKGKLAIPYLKENGFDLIFLDSQAVLVKK